MAETVREPNVTADPAASLTDAERERRRARREFIRRHHPDRGGDPAAFVVGLRSHTAPPEPSRTPLHFYRRRRGVAALWDRLGRQLRRRGSQDRPGPRVR